MIDLTSLWIFVGAVVLLLLSPGPNMAFVISHGVSYGWRGGVAAGLGIGLADLLLTALTATGALYLMWLGIGLWRKPATVSSAPEQTQSAGARWHWTVKGASVSGLNPKQLLLLLALLPQFVRPSEPWPVFAQIMALGAVHAASCCFVYFGVGWGSQSVLRSRPAAAQAVSRLSGAMMMLIALLLLGDIAVQLA